MVIIHESDKYKYYDKQRKVNIIKYSNGVKKVVEASAFYLPRRMYNGDGILNDIIKFVSDNKETIKNIAGVAGTVADSVGKIGTTTLDIVTKVRELKNKQPITDDAIDKILNATEVKRSGFFYV